MGKKKRDGSHGPSMGGGFSPPPSSSSSGGQRPGGCFAFRDEAGLCVRRQAGGLAYLSGITFGLVCLCGIQLALSPTFPQLLCHWVWVVLTAFGVSLAAMRWAKYDEAAAYLIFWCLSMVHGLVWVAAVFVPVCGVLPGALWQAYGAHGGDHLGLASLGSLVLLLLPPVLLLAFMWFEREFLVVIYHDFFYAMDGLMFNLTWQLFSPALPLWVWASFFRPPLFSDLPTWPGTPAVLATCALANAPAIFYAYSSTRHFRGPAHWFLGGGIVWAVGAQASAF